MNKTPLKSFTLALIVSALTIMALNGSPDYPIRDADAVSRIILPGNYPDPSLVKVGEKYYLTHNTDDNNPGLPIWESTDLQNWTRITNILHTHIGAVWAPDIIFYENQFYVYFTVKDPNGVLRNFVVKANDIKGPWSSPIEMKVDGIDPGHIATPEGERYVYMSKGWIYPLSDDGLTITGEGRHVYDGWPIPKEWLIECFCAESPKLIYKDGYYHLITAQGGTAGPATSHMVVSARSKNIDGPWENSPHNPIIRTWEKSERLWSKGHGTLFEDHNGNWKMVYHAYEKDFLTLGRMVAIAPIVWTEDNWFHIGTEIDLEDVEGQNWKEDFSGPDMLPNLSFLSRKDAKTGYELKDGKIHLEAVGESISDQAVLLSNSEHHSYQIDTKLSVTGDATAGMLLYYDDQSHGGIAIRGDRVSQIVKTNDERSPAPIQKGQDMWLRIKYIDHDVAMYYSKDGETWEKFDFGMEVSGWHHNSFGRFRSLRVGLFCYGDGSAAFDYFKYKAL